ncbi:hypothetical protein Ddc_20880 [Ditylenchus destructor]|nr:hypothetical protein Ddc_20880 [Ditylenchus destructor]
MYSLSPMGAPLARAVSTSTYLMPIISAPIRGVKRSHLKQQDYSQSKTKFPSHKNFSKSFQGPQFIVQKQNHTQVNETLEKIVADLNAIKAKSEKQEKDTEKKYAESIRNMLKEQFQEFLSTMPTNGQGKSEQPTPMEDEGCTSDGEADGEEEAKP